MKRGQVHGALTLVRTLPRGPQSTRRWLCLCACGAEVAVTESEMRLGRKSCGCRGAPGKIERHLDIYVERPEGPAPKTRAECINGPRPCPWKECRHHLGTTCVLDQVDAHGDMTLAEVAELCGVSVQEIHNVEVGALRKLAGDAYVRHELPAARRFKAQEIDPDEEPDAPPPSRDPEDAFWDRIAERAAKAAARIGAPEPPPSHDRLHPWISLPMRKEAAGE